MTDPIAGLKGEHRHFDLSWTGEIVTLSFARTFAKFLGLRERRSEVRNRVQSHLKDFGIALNQDADHASANVVTRKRLAEALKNLDAELGAIARRPLTAGQVQRLLNISSTERSRWTRDGRLRQHGTSLIKRGQLISLRTYAPDDIENLFQHPEQIQEWRAQDAIREQVPKQLTAKPKRKFYD